MPVLIKAIILSFFIFLINNQVNAANLSIELGKNSTGVAVGRDFGFGYGLVGLSAKFITDGPWSYVPTEESLKNSCNDFHVAEPVDPDESDQDESKAARDCNENGVFDDGDEWEVFGKLGFRIPVFSRFFVNTGLGISKKRTSELFTFCDDIKLACKWEGGEKVCETKPENDCYEKAGEFVTWGHVEENYYLNFIGGISVEITRRMLLNIDYHTRQGLLSGIMWRF